MHVIMSEGQDQRRSPCPTLSDHACIQALEDVERSLENPPKTRLV